MSVPYYLGTKAILERLGYRSPKVLTRLIVKDGLPVYKRVGKTKDNNGRGRHRCWCISESAITAWEIALGQKYVQEVRRRTAIQNDKKRYALSA